MDQQSRFFRDTWAEINLDHITYNVESMRKYVAEDIEVFAVVKANGYGHGDVEIANAALEAGATYLAVATLDEALALRQKGITAPVLVLGASRSEDAQTAVENGITLTIFQVEWLLEAKRFIDDTKGLSVHVKFDSGMGRLGIQRQEEWQAIETELKAGSHFKLEGIFTHFATADEIKVDYFDMQLERFNQMLSWVDQKPKYIHASNSAAGLRFAQSHFNAVRFGISMYGLTPSLEMESVLPFPLKEAFSLQTKLVHVKKLNKGEKVSYGATYEAEADEWVGTLPIGYADGWIRKLGKQEVLVGGKRTPIVGRICMDQCMIRLTDELPLGTAVTLIGEQGQERISVNEIAQRLETINYEVTCQISSRVPRVYKRAGKVVSVRNMIL
ncbi:alanine racemase [Cytobacillus purgationiresistens]|uniref:alanine racemase n=1 Tax=Cytobacillus purgationiresistens TaxID=863449 RepID=UPI0027D7BB5D|nr:alanine racemase [Cytobacillus purgationiresistens]